VCVANQHVIHVHWEWCFASVVRCSIHRTALQVVCPVCGEGDPLNFESQGLMPNHNCRACGGSLTDQAANYPSLRKDERAIQAVEEAYRAALLGVSPHPSLVGKATDHAFRRFVDDMLQLLISFPQPSSVTQNKRDRGAAIPSRQSPLTLIADLISNAAPSSDKRVQSFRYRQSLKIWATLFSRISESEGFILECASRHWPMALQRRFASALHLRTRSRWPYDRFRWTTVCPRFNCRDAIVVRDLTAVK
jgi:hypothetical protein